MSNSPTLYFAYGSNINLDQMEQRCPDAVALETVTLDGYELAFRAGGVATIIQHEGSQVNGLLWELTPKCEEALDFYEGFPRLYTKEQVTVTGNDGYEFQVMAYVMTADFARNPHIPSMLYYNGIYDGYEQNEMDTKPLEAALRRCREEVKRAEALYGQTSLFRTKTKKKEKER